MSEPMKYDNLDYTPTQGHVEVRSGNKRWNIPVNVECGRDMEAEGFTVYWVHSVIPENMANFGGIFMTLSRLFTWPSRWGKK